MCGVYERGDVGSASTAVHPAGEEGGAAGDRGQLGLDAGAAAVQNRAVAIVSQSYRTFPVKRERPAEPHFTDFSLDLRRNREK